MSLDAGRVLIDDDHFIIQEDIGDSIGHCPDIVAGDQRGRHNGPEAELAFVFVVSAAGIPHFQHIRVVPVAGTGIGIERLIDIGDIQERAEVVVDIAGRPPEIGGVNHPGPHIVPAADGEYDGAAAIGQALAHQLVLGLQVQRSITAVFLQVIDAPGGVCRSILRFMALASAQRDTAACRRAAVAVNPELEPLGVDVIAQGLHAARKAIGIAHQIAVRIAGGVVHPVIVQDQVDIAGVSHPGADQCVGYLLDFGFVDSVAEAIIAVPSHGRRQGKPVCHPRAHEITFIRRSAPVFRNDAAAQGKEEKKADRSRKTGIL